jgi:2,5-diketo-D-gluconate reductase A
MTDSSTMPALPDDAVTLDGGGSMPLLGFGTWQITGREAVTATTAALEAGYRHLDTATVYGNEAEVGRALRDSGVARDDVFVTTKCPPNQAGRELQTLRQSLDALGTDHVDLWLIHWPGNDASNLSIWRAFVEARKSGLARDIGVSNFDVETIDELTSDTGVAPAVNQIEWSPLLFDASVLDEHRRRKVALEGYSALRATRSGSGATPTSPASSCPLTRWPPWTVSAEPPDAPRPDRTGAQSGDRPFNQVAALRADARDSQAS